MPTQSMLVSSSTQASQHRPRKRWTRDQLLRSLQFLSDLPPPLSHTLPLSPPCSRPTSPAPGSKRKPLSAVEPDHPKRPRTSPVEDRHHHIHPPPSGHTRAANPHPTLQPRSEPCEDGEVREDLPPPPRSATVDSARPPPNAVPIRRPKRGVLPLSHFDHLHDKYYQAGRTLKYSGDARFWSTYPPTHKEYRPLLDPPVVNSLYHKYGGLIARLELLDALVCFTYSIWTRDYCRKTCTKETWTTITAFLSWCKSKWLAQENAIDEAEKTFIGLIYMIESFIDGRKMFYTVRQELDRGLDRITEQAKLKIEAAIQEAEQNATGKSQGTPPMLPSPASIAPTNSANSTPTNRDGSTPNTVSRPPAPSQNPPPQQPRQQGPPKPNPAFFPLLPRRIRESPAPPPSSYLEAASKVTEPIDASMIYNLKDLTATYRSTASSMAEAQRTLNLATLSRHFPTTFSRMVNSTLSPTEEHEPDFEDEEGELFWPGQLVTGEGLGWVCLMGKAMISEFGKAYGYKGLSGAVPKPNDAPKPFHHPQRPQSMSHASSASGSR